MIGNLIKTGRVGHFHAEQPDPPDRGVAGLEAPDHRSNIPQAGRPIDESGGTEPTATRTAAPEFGQIEVGKLGLGGQQLRVPGNGTG